jgi:DNA-binding transcriptional ArsR family regulator
MADLLPSTPDLDDAEPDEPRVVGVDTDDADDVLSALSSETARQIVTALHEEPAPASALADSVDTSLQNTQYHLGRLADAGLVEVVDTTYSEKGREMDVYAPADRALVVVAGREEDTRGLKSALKRLLGALVPLAVVAAAAEWLLDGPFAPDLAASQSTQTGAATTQSDSGGDVSVMTTEGAKEAADTAAQPGLIETVSTSPGAMLLLGGLLALTLVFVWGRLRQRRTTP